MFNRLYALTQPRGTYDDPIRWQQVRSLLLYLMAGFVIAVIASVFLTAQFINTLPEIDLNTASVFGILSPFLVLILFGMVRQGFYRIGAFGILGMSLISPLGLWSAETIADVLVLTYVVPIVTAGLLLGRRSTVLIFLVVIGLLTGPTLVNNNLPEQFFTATILLFTLNVLVFMFGTTIQQAAAQFITERNRLQQIIEGTLSTRQESDERRAIFTTISIIRDQLRYTFARVYMVDNGEIVQRVQSGLNLQQINIESKLTLDTRSGLHEAMRRGETLIIEESDDILLRQHLLTGTRGALAIPVTDQQGQVIAIIDVQSEDQNSFATTELQTLQMVALQLGQSLAQSRLITNLRQNIQEQDAVIERQRQRIRQYEDAERQTTTESWTTYLKELGVSHLGYDLPSLTAEPVESTSMGNDLQSALATGDITVEQDGDQQVVRVPIQLRQQTIGAMSFRLPAGNDSLNAREHDLIQNVVQRLSLALENKRLFEQNQAQAQRESKANQIGNLLLTSTDINTVLELAAQNFNEALGAVQTQIRLKPDVQVIGEGEVTS
ncbi:MAG: GAF domain-containing protein [Anaerolineae bacterium]